MDGGGVGNGLICLIRFGLQIEKKVWVVVWFVIPKYRKGFWRFANEALFFSVYMEDHSRELGYIDEQDNIRHGLGILWESPGC